MPSKQTTAKDPVCGMDVDRNRAVTAEHEGETYQFCSQSCKAEFEANPQAYAQRGGTKSRSAGPREQQGAEAGRGKSGQGGPSGQSRPGQSGQREPAGQNPRGTGEERGAPRSTDRLSSKSTSPREMDDEDDL